MMCDCNDSEWILSTYDVIRNVSGKWMIVWTVIDKTEDNRYYKQDYAVKIDYCPFCGKKIIKGKGSISYD